MRKIISFNQAWQFYKDESGLSPQGKGEKVALPHTWNAKDGQDGGNDYFRGSCLYKKSFLKSELPEAEEYYLEIMGANSSATVYVNGNKAAHHDGGYSLWRVRLTEFLAEENELSIVVDNAPNDFVYPQMADFTFYGGLYRDVNIICVPKTHFELDYFGGSGVKVTPVMQGADADVCVETFVTDMQSGDKIVYTLFDKEGKELVRTESAERTVYFVMKDVQVWQGRKNPYLYRCEAELVRGNETLDKISCRFGCRSFSIDPQKGFMLNGEKYPLRGVSRHQDRWGIGNALLPKHHKEDIDLIMEVGATTVRLAHYQHDPYFYDLCDEKGLVVWAEIPYISKHLPNGRENTVTQMKELVIQNYNHPSIVVWGLSNEITMGGASDPDLIENHKMLNELVHGMDKTRLTTMACVSMCDMDEPYVQIPDVVAYNHYFGWYGGDTSMNGPWFDKFHKKFPDKPIGVSEYGCEGLNWHTSEPKQGDYTEEYQAYYHEELIKQLFTRDYLWATYVWNMFDFGADARAEGGENGQNHKGLVTFDRSYKKDAFYAYKAWLSDEPFVHLCGKRYIDRVEDVTRVTVYSNQPEVELFVNGKSLEKKRSKEHFFYFDVPNAGESVIVAKAGELTDEGKLRKVDEMNPDYLLKEKGAVLNWFDIEEPKGYYSLNDKMSDIMSSEEGKEIFDGIAKEMQKAMSGGGTAGFEMSEDMTKMMGGFTMLRLLNLMGTMNVKFTKEQLLELNARLNRIPKPKK